MDSFFILSEMTDKKRRLAPAQYEPQTEQSFLFSRVFQVLVEIGLIPNW